MSLMCMKTVLAPQVAALLTVSYKWPWAKQTLPPLLSIPAVELIIVLVAKM
jgi:hypothetical protein